MSSDDESRSIGSGVFMLNTNNHNNNNSQYNIHNNNKTRSQPRVTKQQYLQRCIQLFPCYTAPTLENASVILNKKIKEENINHINNSEIHMKTFLPPISILSARPSRDNSNIPQQNIEKRNIEINRESQLQLIRVLGGGVFGVVFFAKEVEEINNSLQVQEISKKNSLFLGLQKESQPLLKLPPTKTTLGDNVFSFINNPLYNNKNESNIIQEKKRSYIAVKFIDLEGQNETRRKSALREVEFLISCKFFSILSCYRERIRYLHPGDSPSLNNPIIGVALELEYANNGDLREEIKTRIKKNFKFFSERDALLIFVQILMAIYYLHRRGIIHRDIKTANVLLCSNGVAKLGDFGLSKIIENGDVNQEKKGSFVGTPYYITPEIWLRKPYGKKADMFSLGVLLHELITLKRPFGGKSIEEIRRNILEKTPSLPNNINSDISNLILSLLEKNPDSRPSAEEVLSLPIMRMIFATFLQCVLRESQELSSSNCKNRISNTSDTFIHGGERSDSIWRLSLTERQQILFDLEQIHKDLLSREYKISAVGHHIRLSSLKSDILLNSSTRILLDGILQKEIDGFWKTRYLCLQWVASSNSRDISAEDGINEIRDIELILALKKNSTQRVSKRMYGFIDCYIIPERFAPASAPFVFALLSKVGKTSIFQTSSEEERQKWVSACLESINYQRRYDRVHDSNNSSDMMRENGSGKSFTTLQTCSTISARSIQTKLENNHRSNTSYTIPQNSVPPMIGNNIMSRRRFS